MSCCPRCVKPVEPDTDNCPHCGYDIPPMVSATASSTELSMAEPVGRDAVDLMDPVDTASSGELWLLPAEWAQQTDVISHRSDGELLARLYREWRSRLPLFVAVAAAIVLIVLITVFAEPGGSGSLSVAGAGTAARASVSSARPTPQNGQQQAAVIGGYLTQSAAARRGVSGAIASINGCQNVPGAVATLQSAANARTQILAALTDAQVSALPGGSGMLADLRQALQASAEADRHYAAWGATATASCSGHAAHTPDYSAAQQSDNAATAAKQRFVQSWNRVAAQFGLSQQSASTF
jgi:hypothetical protein